MNKNTKYFKITYVLIPILVTLILGVALVLGAEFSEVNTSRDYYLHPILTSLNTQLFILFLFIPLFILSITLLLIKPTLTGLKRYFAVFPALSIVIMVGLFLTMPKKSSFYGVYDTLMCNGKSYQLVAYSQGTSNIATSEKLIYFRKVSGLKTSTLEGINSFNKIKASDILNDDVRWEITGCLE